MQPLVMGVVNVTPDSFFDGGRWFDPDDAVAHGLRLFAEGADVVDVGGESTRPGAEPVDEDEERRRVVGVVEALAPHGRVSIDTRKPGVAEAAIEAGATLVNDVSASLWEVVAASGGAVGWVAMHMQGDPATMQVSPSYEDVVGEVRAFLVDRADRARSAGVEEVWIDPGIGFGKTVGHNLSLLRHLRVLAGSGYPVLVGTSRKGFIGKLTAGLRGPNAVAGLRGPNAVAGLRGPNAVADDPVSVNDRLEGSLATAVWAMAHGAGMVRVHDVPATVQASRLLGSNAA